MIDRETGGLSLADGCLGVGTTPEGARAMGFAPAGPPGLLVREAADTRGRAVLVALRFVDRLVGIELRYAVRRPAEDVRGNPDWEMARKEFHDAILREWLASSVHDLLYAPPPQPGPLAWRFPWGGVRSDHDPRGACVELRYADGDQ